jgi:hypothetical protein
MSAVRHGWRKLAGWWRRQETAPPSSPWLARQVRDNTQRASALERRMAELEAEVAQQRALRASGIEGVRRALDSAGVPVPDSVMADAPTMPYGLRRVV